MQISRSAYRFPDWQPEYEAVMMTTDIGDLKIKMDAFEGAIFNRCQVIAAKFGYELEREAIQMAATKVREHQTTQLVFPPWEQDLASDSRFYVL